MYKITRSLILLSLVLLFSGFYASSHVMVEEVSRTSKPSANRSRGLQMLDGVKDTLEKYYYDKSYRGIDIDQKFKEAREKIKTLDTNAQIFRVIAGLLLEFNDSHTRFYPPGRSNRVEYGFAMQIIGADCYVVDVTKGSNAEKQGIVPGDVVVRIGQYPVTRDSLWAINYFLYALEPMPQLPIVIRKSDKSERSLLIDASFKTFEERQVEAEKKRKEKRENPYKCHRFSGELTACKLRTFSVDRKFIDQMMRESEGSSKLILDLRGNSGGYVKIEEYLTGHFFDRDVKIADMVTRKKTETRIAKPVDERKFKGELIVLIDSNSASASEVFSRVIQIEKRGKIVGDTSAGAVMTSYGLTLAIVRGPGDSLTVAPYGVNVTIGDMIMSDGKRLEAFGVQPDVPVGPSGQALRQKTDPVLAYAAELFGVKVTPEDAGKLNFLFKPAETDVDGEEGDDEKP